MSGHYAGIPWLQFDGDDSKTQELMDVWKNLDDLERSSLLRKATELAGVVFVVGGPLNGSKFRNNDEWDDEWWYHAIDELDYSPGKVSLYEWDGRNRLEFCGFCDADEVESKGGGVMTPLEIQQLAAQMKKRAERRAGVIESGGA